jgi:hypothetical protein
MTDRKPVLIAEGIPGRNDDYFRGLFLQSQKDLAPEFSEIVSENFWDIIGAKEKSDDR